MSDDTLVYGKPPWHDSLWRLIARIVDTDRLAHGLLICGPPGVGKRVFAERLVRTLLCRARDEQGDACGVCAGCRQYAAGSHPDVSRLVPEEPGRMIKVEQVRAFGHRLHLTSQYDSGRVGWIEPAEQLSISAGNSLLKTLEEPPPGCHLVLVTDRVPALLPTIRSRCQHWRVPPPEPHVARAWLSEQGVAADTLDTDSLHTPFAVIARGRRDYAELAPIWDEDLTALIAGRLDAVGVAENVAGQPADLWLDWLYRRAGALLAAALGDTSDDSLPPALHKLAVGLDAAALAPWCAQVMQAGRLARTNADWRLVVESLLLNLGENLQRRRAS